MSDDSSTRVPYKKLPPNEKWFYERITLGLPSALRKVSGVHKVEVQRRRGCSEEQINNWELTNECRLPQDLKNFYKSTDGFNLTWGYTIDGSVVPIGRLVVNKLDELKQLYHDNMLALSSLIPHEQPRFDRLTDKIFSLEFTRDACYICLVYMGHKEEYSIWLLDRSFEWHFLSTTFTKYFRVMLVHQGLPQWQLTMTPLGMAPWAEQLAFSMSRHVVCKKDNKFKAVSRDSSNVSPEIQALAVAEEQLITEASDSQVSDEGTLSYEEEEIFPEEYSSVTSFDSDIDKMYSNTENDSLTDSIQESDDDSFQKMGSNESIEPITPIDSMEEFKQDEPTDSRSEFMKLLERISKYARNQRQLDDIYYGDDEYYD